MHCELFRVGKKYNVRKKNVVFFFILVSNFRQLLEFTVVFFFTIILALHLHQVILIWSPISYTFALKAELRQPFLFSSSDWAVGGANFVVTNYRQRTQIKVNG